MMRRNKILWFGIVVALGLLTSGCNLLGLATATPGEVGTTPVDGSGVETEDREFFVGRDLKDDQSCMVAGVIEKKQTIPSAFLQTSAIVFSIVEEGETEEISLPFDRDFSVYRFHQQLVSYLGEITVPEGPIAKISLEIASTRATVHGEGLEIYLPGRKVELEFQPPKPSNVPLPALCLAERLLLSEGGVSLSPPLFQFRGLGGALAGVMGLSVGHSEE